MDPQLRRNELPYPKLRGEMQLYMRKLIQEAKLPHDLLDQHWIRGAFQSIAPHEILLSPSADCFPVDGLATPDGVPETLAKKDYSADRVEALFERWKQHLGDKDQARVAAGKPSKNIESLTLLNGGLPQEIDGVRCILLGSWLEEGINRKKTVDAMVKSLGYSKAKGKNEVYDKRLSESERLTVSVDMAAEWRVRYLRASMIYHAGSKSAVFPLVYWGAFSRIEWQNTENMVAMMITTERILRMAIENVGFLVANLEENCLEGWRKAVMEGES